jgi:hypothetical protein
LESENWDAAKSVFRSLPNEVARERAARFLASQLDGEVKFAAIGYFVVGLLRELGFLGHALARLQKLRGTASKYSLGDALRLLAGLLRYRHDVFSDVELDALEDAIKGVESAEGVFEIPERIRAVRMLRLRRNP